VERQSASESGTSTPYSDEQLDRALAQTLHSDRTSVTAHVVALLVAFWFMGRAIVLYDVGAGFLLLPIAFDTLTIFWMGLFLSWFVVDCPQFAAMARWPVFVLASTAAVALVICCVLAVEDEAADWSRVGPGWVSGWHTAIESGLAWAFVVGALGLLYSSIREVLVWRRDGGAFVWTSTIDSFVRLAALILAVVPTLLALGVLDSLYRYLFGDNAAAWRVFTLLAIVEAAAVVMGVKIHRKVLAKGGSIGVGRGPR